MSSRGSPRQVFLGAMLALALVTGLGVALGELVADLFPGDLVALGSGLFSCLWVSILILGSILQEASTPKGTHLLGKPLGWSF